MTIYGIWEHDGDKLCVTTDIFTPGRCYLIVEDKDAQKGISLNPEALRRVAEALAKAAGDLERKAGAK